MTAHVVHYSKLSERDRKAAAALPKLSTGDRVELRIQRKSGKVHVVGLSAPAAAVIEMLLARLSEGERVAILSEEQELSPAEASEILGISRPLVVLRMDRGELPFRYVGKHRRARLKDVLALKHRLDARRTALDSLADDTEGLIGDHGL
ncbi:MAG: helix-turn-helix domain-containing protein [Parvibaculaceae bacterium]